MKLIDKIRLRRNPWNQELMQQKLREMGVTIGERCRIFSSLYGPECYLITLGDNVTIATGVKFVTHDNSISKPCPQHTDLFGRITIGNNCFIGAYSVLLPGVTIGDNAIVAAGSLVCKSVKTNEIWGGVPARKIGMVKDFADRMEPFGINTRGLSYEEKKQLLLSTDRLISK